MRNLFNTLALLIVLTFISCSPKESEFVVADYGKNYIGLEEFEKAYSKNMGGFEESKDDSLEQYKNFLDLYVNFKMKLRDAFVRGFESDEDMINELDSYKRKVGASYVLEKDIIEPGIKKFYEDRNYELRVSHIMFRPDPTLFDARKEAEDVLKQLKEGANFEELAEQYSDDTYSNKIGGDIYWITAGQLKIPDFEQAAYNTKVGEIYQELVKTSYGFHIIKVIEKQKRRYKLQARHILINFGNTNGQTDTSDAYTKIADIKKQLDEGADFAELAKQFSDDKASGEKEGDLGFIQRRQMVKPFDETAFNLKVGETSGIVKTRFGYHIIKVTDEQQYPDYEEEKANLREIYKKARYPFDLEIFVSDLKIKYQYSKIDDLEKEIHEYADTIRFNNSYWDSEFRVGYKDKSIFQVNNKPVIVDSLFTFAIKDDKLKGKIINNSSSLVTAIDKYTEQMLIQEKALDLEKTNDDFASLMKDYKKGIFIFKIQEDEVWNRIKIDSNDVKKYYEANKEKYITKNRVDFSEILCKSDSVAAELCNELNSGADFDSLAKANTKRRRFKNKMGHHGMLEVTSGELAAIAFSLESENEISKPIKTKDGWSIIRLNKKDPTRLKTYKEAKAEASSEYQESMVKALELEYINKLKDLYSPQYHYEVLESAFKERNN